MRTTFFTTAHTLDTVSYIQDPYELELLEQCLKDDRKAQRALYDKYKDAMYTRLYRMLGDEEQAADALQEAFVDIFRKLSSYEKRSSLGAWIKIIVIRKGLARQKKKPLFFDTLDNVPDDDQKIEWDENLTGEYLEKGIRQLPDGYRNVFLLTEVEGYTHREAAELMNISEGTSKSQLFKAKKLLRVKLKELMS